MRERCPRRTNHSRATPPATPATAGSGWVTSAPSSPPRIAWRAPGTPYSYGPPTTRGISSKLKIGGGEETSHSIVFERHGLSPARGPHFQLTIKIGRAHV